MRHHVNTRRSRIRRCAGLVAVALLAASAAAAQSVRGTATFRERMALPPGTTFEALLEDVSRADVAAELIGRILMMPPGNPPISFEIHYDPNRILPTHTYHVRARLLLGDRLLFTTDTAYSVLTRGNADTVSVVMQRVPASPITPPGPRSGVSPPALLQTVWRVTDLANRPVAAGPLGREAHLVLDTEGRASGSDGCNRIAGGYQLVGETIRFSRLAGTLMACSNAGEAERAFRDALGRAQSWRIIDNRLELVDAAGTLLARFEASGR